MIKGRGAQERRKYIRLDTVFPVQFCLKDPSDKKEISEWLQGFTNNVGKGGICLEASNIKKELIALIEKKNPNFLLKIELPVTKQVIHALAQLAWIKEVDSFSERYLFGLHYLQVDRRAVSKIMRYAWMKKLFVPVSMILMVLFAAGFILGSFFNARLVKDNRMLVDELVKTAQESIILKEQAKVISKDKEDLEFKIQALQERLDSLKRERNKLGELSEKEKIKSQERINELNKEIGKLNTEKNILQEDLKALQSKEVNAAEELRIIGERKNRLEKVNVQKMYQWLSIHQNPKTGLVISFEGDSGIEDWAFLYDQSLVAQAYVLFSDYERAKRCLEFFRNCAKTKNGLFFNAYYASGGQPAEYTVHCGPNIWLGIAIIQYFHKTNDNQFLGIAENIASAIIAIQNQDPDGGIRGGLEVTWYSTEHNLDAYSFFGMLYKVTKKEKYLVSQKKILDWLLKYTYTKWDIPIKRGKGDSTIATDTYAWSIAAIGPAKLESLGMDPDKIIEFAEDNCSVEVVFLRPEGYSIKLKGFDFAPEKNLARGGVVSSEWTAQMIVALKIMSEYHYKKGDRAKGNFYELKANEYLSSLEKMIISSPSPSGQGKGCLPYATQELVDTGHGWQTPKGSSTGSIAGTAYALFAYYGYNPLQLDK